MACPRDRLFIFPSGKEPTFEGQTCPVIGEYEREKGKHMVRTSAEKQFQESGPCE